MASHKEPLHSKKKKKLKKKSAVFFSSIYFSPAGTAGPPPRWERSRGEEAVYEAWPSWVRPNPAYENLGEVSIYLLTRDLSHTFFGGLFSFFLLLLLLLFITFWLSEIGKKLEA